MLVLSRKVGQRILIGDNTEVVVLSVDGHQVKLGIEAPRQVHVLRYELVEDVQQENRRAAVSPATRVPLGTFLQGIAQRGQPPETTTPAAVVRARG